MTRDTDPTRRTDPSDVEKYRKPGDHVELFGISASGAPYYYDPVDYRLAPGTEQEGEVVPEWERGYDVGPDRTLSDVVEAIEERVGWDQLTDRAHELLEREE